MESTNNEIDIIELTKNSIIYLHSFIIRWYKFLLILFIVGIIIGYWDYYTRKDYFENKVFGTSYVIPTALLVNFINNLNVDDINKSETNQDINNQNHNSIIFVKADSLGNSVNNDQLKVSILEIQIGYKNELDINKFIQSLNEIIDSNSYFREEIKFEQYRLQEMIRNCENEIRKIDTLKDFERTSNMKNLNFNCFEKKTSNGYPFSSELLNLIQNKFYFENKLKHNRGFILIDFHADKKIRSLHLIKSLFKPVIFLLLFGVIIFIFIDFKRKYIKDIPG